MQERPKSVRGSWFNEGHPMIGVCEASEYLTVVEATQTAQTRNHRPFLELFQTNDACVDNAPSARIPTTYADQPTFDPDKGAFLGKPVHEVPCRLCRGARAAF